MQSIKKLGSTASVGSIVCSLSPTPPNGYLRLDGSTIKQKDYPELYSVIANYKLELSGSIWLPDFRGRFLRGANGNTLTFQDDMVKAHQHIEAWGENSGAYAEFGVSTYPRNRWGSSATDCDNYKYLTNDGASSIDKQDWVGVENRPINIAVHYYIKY